MLFELNLTQTISGVLMKNPIHFLNTLLVDSWELEITLYVVFCGIAFHNTECFNPKISVNFSPYRPTIDKILTIKFIQNRAQESA
jgi:hypothetical protein